MYLLKLLYEIGLWAFSRLLYHKVVIGIASLVPKMEGKNYLASWTLAFTL